MSLKVSTEPKENRQLAMTIEVEEDRVNQELRKAARKVARQLKIPGFRKGRAPYNVVVQRVGVGALFEEFLDDLGQEVYKQAIDQESIEPYAVASLDNIELEPLRYQLTVPLAPEVKLGDYRSLRIEESEPEIDEEEVEARLDEIRERNAGYQTMERPSEYGDLITIDVRAVVLDEEGNETDTVVLEETDWDVTPDAENPMEPAGFDEALLGLEPGTEETFEIAWPEDSQSLYAGKNVRFQVKVHEIQAYQTPELTDELAQTVGPDFETVDDLVESIRESVQEEVAQEIEADYLEEVLDALVEMSELDYPPAAIEFQIDQMIQNTDAQLRRMGLQGIEQYLAMQDKSMEEHREELRDEAEQYLRRNLVLSEVIEAEKLTVSDEEFEERLAEMVGEPSEEATGEEQESRQQFVEMMQQEGNRRIIDEQILSEKAIERVLAIVRGEEVPEPGAEVETEATAESEAAESVHEVEGEAEELPQTQVVAGEGEPVVGEIEEGKVEATPEPEETGEETEE